MLKSLFLAAGLAVISAGGAQAQQIVPEIWGNTLMGDAALSNTREIGNEGRRSETRERSNERGCSLEAMPASERAALQREYARRHQADGRDSADRWAAEQGRLFRERLRREGVCTD